MRDSTQPTFLSLVRIRLQSSMTEALGFGAGVPCPGAEVPGSAMGGDAARDRANQFAGGLGGATGFGSGAAVLGESLWPITCILPFSGICKKLGEVRVGSVCTFSVSK